MARIKSENEEAEVTTNNIQKPKGSLQDTYLRKAQSENRTVKIFLINGVPVDGKVLGFDNFTIALQEDKTGKEILIYKHAVSTIKE